MYGENTHMDESRKAIFMSTETKEKFNLLKSEYISKTKKHIKWDPFLDVIINIVDKEIKKMADNNPNHSTIPPENMVGIDDGMMG